jgi:predicted GIY-YIG superfamily endonuclease
MDLVLLSRFNDIMGEVIGLVKRRFGGNHIRSGPCVYLLHFPDGSHYIGYTRLDPIERLRRHLAGRGSGWVYRRAQRVGVPLLGVVEFQVSVSAAIKAERHYKRHSWKLRSRCVFCSVAARAAMSIDASEGMFGEDQVRGFHAEVCSAADA